MGKVEVTASGGSKNHPEARFAPAARPACLMLVNAFPRRFESFFLGGARGGASPLHSSHSGHLFCMRPSELPPAFLSRRPALLFLARGPTSLSSMMRSSSSSTAGDTKHCRRSEARRRAGSE